MLAGRPAVAARPDGDQGDRKIRYFASAHAARRRGDAPTARRDGEADRDPSDPGRVVCTGAWSASTAARSMSPTSRRWRPFGRPGAGTAKRLSANPLRLPSRESAPRVVRQPDGRLRTREITLAKAVLAASGRACCAWRTGNFSVRATQLRGPPAPTCCGASRRTCARRCEQPLSDGSYLSHIYPSERDRRRDTNGVKVRVIDYRLDGVTDAEPIYRLVTTIWTIKTPAAKLAALYLSVGKSRRPWTN